jgi:uncharacterized protein (TIGR02186 family)
MRRRDCPALVLYAISLVISAGLTPIAAEAASLVSTLSENKVEITSSFNGERIVVFGAIRGVPDDGSNYQVAVVVQGPDQDLVIRRKQRVLGVWVNRTTREFKEVPSYYVMNLSPNFAEALDPAQLGQFRLGAASLPFVADASADGSAQRFAKAVIRLKSNRGLYAERLGEVQFLAPNVFRTTFFLPSVVPTGEYRSSVYLFGKGTFLAGQTQTLRVEKGGFSERIARAADDQPLAYGLICVALALFTGWLAGIIFRRP